MPENQHTDLFEDRFATALRDTGHSFRTDDPAALVTGGRVRGRRTQLLRRSAVLGGAAAVALVGVGGALLVPGNAADATDPLRTSAATGPATTGSPASSTSPGAASYTGDDLLRSLKKLLPRGTFSEEAAEGTESSTPPYAHVVFDDGKGAAAIDLTLNRVEPDSDQAREVTTCPDKEFVDYDSCTSTRLPDGSRLMLFRGYEYPDRRVDTKWWNAELVTRKGQHVSLSEWNAPAQKDAPVSRPRPPLSEAQMKKVVTADVWRRVVDAIPEGLPTGSIGDTLAGLLPDGLTVTGKGGKDDYAFLVVDDGKGGSLVQVNVQPGMSDMADELFGDAEKLPDGRLVTTRTSGGEKEGQGVVMWTADTLRPDGLRVVVSAFNTPAQDQDATRDTPALTLTQLREIALSTEWDAGA
ncbi:hypothetical protein ACFSUJ_22180 [Streptomyces lusitanus]|uniref:LigA protein n=1 Tax=Streptomyces lusitanus TaxID=68232 RepID=A0ABU3JXH4_9ACTN|nr:hypothetical protein [Streptomyces lusitanus]